MKRLVVYDLDGTLVDTLEDIAAGVNHVLRALGATPIATEEVRRHIGRGVHDLIERCLKTPDAKRVDEGIALFRAYYADHFVDRSRLYPDAQNVLDHFRSRQQAVITNKPAPFSRQILETLGVAAYFIDIISGGSDYPHKPDPSSLLDLMRRAGAKPEETLVIGDSPIDVEMGLRAGASTAMVLHGLSDEPDLRAAGPEVLVADFAELLMLARQRKW